MNSASLNPYESAQQKIIPAVLLYAFYQDSVLMIHRNLRKNDIHEGKWNGLGGKLEKNETAKEAASREFHEEANCSVQAKDWKWTGQLFFPNFKAQKNEDWWVNVFVTELTELQARSIPQGDHPLAVEGTLHFVEKAKLMDLNLWDGDRHFLNFVLEQLPFNGTFFYEQGKCVRHEIARIT